MAKLNKPLNTFKNFKGLYSRTESGLVPDNSSSGVYASELLNVQMKDGTITWGKGYAPENDGSTDTTFAVTVADSYVRQAWAYKTMTGSQRKILWLNDGNLLFFNSVLNKYEILEPASALAVAVGRDMGFTVFYRAHADAFERNRAFFGTLGQYAIHTWDGAQTSVASYSSTSVTKQGSTTWTAEGF